MVKKLRIYWMGGGVNLPPKDFCSYWPNGSTDFHAVWSIRRRNLSETGCMQIGSCNSYHLPTWRRKPEVVWFSSLYNAFRDVRATTCARQHSFHRCWPAWNLTTTAQHRNAKCATTGAQNGEPGSGNDSWTERAGEAVPAATPTFSNMPDSDMTLPTWPDIGQHPELKTLATKPEMILSSGCRPMSGHVGSVMSESGMVENGE